MRDQMSVAYSKTYSKSNEKFKGFIDVKYFDSTLGMPEDTLNLLNSRITEIKT